MTHLKLTPHIPCIQRLRKSSQWWGVAEEILVDGGPNLSSKETKNWLQNWHASCRSPSVYYPQSNGHTEAAVKPLKQLRRGNTRSKRTINTDKIAKALLQR